MAKFNLGEFALSLESAAVSDLDTSPVQVQQIPLEDILPNKWNFYALRDLGPLADSIAMEGLLDPLVVTPAGGGKYRLISGHRRRAAIEQLVKDKEHPREDLRLVPCSVRTYKSEAMAKLLMILANSTARVLTNAEVMKQAHEIELSLYQLQEEGYQFPGRMRDQVAAACKVSAPKLGRLKVIREKLIPDYMSLFEKDKLPEQTAYALARLPKGFQERLAKACPEPPAGHTAEQLLKRYEEGWRWEPDLQCPDGKRCSRGDTFLRHDAAGRYFGDMCGGRTCCLNCKEAQRNYSPCERMCSKAKTVRKDARDEAAAREAERKKVLSDRYKAETQGYAKRLLRAIEAAGLPDDTSFPWDYYRSYDVATVRTYAAGQFPEGSVWSSAYLEPGRCHDPAATAKVLQCSTDYLLGVSDDLGNAQAQLEVREAEASPPEAVGPAPAPVPISPTASGSMAGNGWYPVSVTPKEGQRAVVEDTDGEHWLGVFRSDAWMDSYMIAAGSLHALDNPAWWSPWNPRGEEDLAPVWRTEPPERSMPVYARFDAEGTEICSAAWYDSTLQQYFFKKGGAIIDAGCVGWVPLPEEET